MAPSVQIPDPSLSQLAAASSSVSASSFVAPVVRSFDPASASTSSQPLVTSLRQQQRRRLKTMMRMKMKEEIWKSKIFSKWKKASRFLME